MNPYGCNKVICDGTYLYSAHENKRIEFYTINWNVIFVIIFMFGFDFVCFKTL